MKIAIVVHGRFYAFDLARALSKRHDVTVFTNYPKWAVERFGLKRSQVRSFWVHGVLSRVASWLQRKLSLPYPEATLHKLFGQWAAAQILKEDWDVVHPFSGISEEILLATQDLPGKKLMVRASAHIQTQADLLEEEERRTGVQLDRPSRWMIARETREYALAERIIVLSSFARNSFLARNTSTAKLGLLPLGAQLEVFRPLLALVDARCQRILSGQPLRILYVGSLSFQKGFWDMASVIRELGEESFQFRFVGSVSSESSRLVMELESLAEFVPKQPQRELPKWYQWGDLFVFPTIQDGFPVVLAQAQASALPILTTTNCSGPDMIREGETGWVLPIRSPEAFIERLRWCDTHRTELAKIVRRLHLDFRPRTWEDVASDFESLCAEPVTANGR